MTTQALTLSALRHGRPPDPPKLATDASRSRGKQRTWKKTERGRRRCVKNADGKKTNHQKSACSRRLIYDKFGLAPTKGVQAELDSFFGHLQHSAHLVRHVSEQAFALARSKLSLTALPALNDWLIARAEHDGFIPLGAKLP